MALIMLAVSDGRDNACTMDRVEPLQETVRSSVVFAEKATTTKVRRADIAFKSEDLNERDDFFSSPPFRG